MPFARVGWLSQCFPAGDAWRYPHPHVYHAGIGSGARKGEAMNLQNRVEKLEKRAGLDVGEECKHGFDIR